MGLSPFSSSTDEGYEPVAGNPVPTHFEIVHLEDYGTNTVAVIHYPDAISYEGMKILVFQGTSPQELRNLRKIDPHFTGDGIAPFARFEPTQEGLMAAQLLAQNIPPTKGNREPLRVCEVCKRIARVASYTNRVCFDCLTEG